MPASLRPVQVCMACLDASTLCSTPRVHRTLARPRAHWQKPLSVTSRAWMLSSPSSAPPPPRCRRVHDSGGLVCVLGGKRLAGLGRLGWADCSAAAEGWLHFSRIQVHSRSTHLQTPLRCAAGLWLGLAGLQQGCRPPGDCHLCQPGPVGSKGELGGPLAPYLACATLFLALAMAHMDFWGPAALHACGSARCFGPARLWVPRLRVPRLWVPHFGTHTWFVGLPGCMQCMHIRTLRQHCGKPGRARWTHSHCWPLCRTPLWP